MRLSHEPCFKDEAEAALGPRGKPLVGFLRHVRRMIVQDDLDRGVGRVGGIELFEKADEFARAVAVFDAGMNLPGEQVNPREQAQRPVALVFMVAREAGMPAGDRGQVRCRVGDRLDTRLLVVGDKRNLGRGVLRRCRFGSHFGSLGLGRTQDRNFLINAQNFGHLGLERRVPPFQVVPHSHGVARAVL